MKYIMYAIAVIVCIPIAIFEAIWELSHFILGCILLILTIWFHPFWKAKYRIFIYACLNIEFVLVGQVWRKYTSK